MKRNLAYVFMLLVLAFTVLTGCQGKTHKEVVSGLSTSQKVIVASAIREHGYFDLTCRDAQGNVKWEEKDVPNALSNEGEYLIEDVFFRGTAPPTYFYLRLYNSSATPALTSTLTTLSSYEPATQYGYDPTSTNQRITRDSSGFPLVPQLATSHYEISTKTITISATGAISNLNYAALATTGDNTGKLVAYAQLQAVRTLANLDSLQITYKIRLQ